jgi:hypothetical protein
MCELSPWSRGPYSGRSTVDSRLGLGGALTGAWRAAATEGGSSPREHLKKEGAEGNLTVGEGGAARGRSEAGDDGPKRRRVGAWCGMSGDTERRSKEWDEVRWGVAVLGVPFIGRRAERRGREAGGR